mmetsp:Transcript_74154/g.191295  ORF Transcript_74154/g.191295 Transcript_74154/m.191295 type:complete len:207 (+) Transcript_74154:371-991(+)
MGSCSSSSLRRPSCSHADGPVAAAQRRQPTTVHVQSAACSPKAAISVTATQTSRLATPSPWRRRSPAVTAMHARWPKAALGPTSAEAAPIQAQLPGKTRRPEATRKPPRRGVRQAMMGLRHVMKTSAPPAAPKAYHTKTRRGTQRSKRWTSTPQPPANVRPRTAPKTTSAPSNPFAVASTMPVKARKRMSTMTSGAPVNPPRALAS